MKPDCCSRTHTICQFKMPQIAHRRPLLRFLSLGHDFILAKPKTWLIGRFSAGQMIYTAFCTASPADTLEAPFLWASVSIRHKKAKKRR